MADPATHEVTIRPVLRRIRRRLALKRVLSGLGLAALVAGLAHLLGLDGRMMVTWAVTVAFALVGAALIAGRIRPTPDAALAEHLNRHLPGLQESAQLLLEAPESLTPARRLQRGRVQAALANLPVGRQNWLPRAWTRSTTALWLAGIALFLLATPAHRWVASTQSTPVPAADETSAFPSSTRWVELEVLVTPPAYTGLAPTRQDNLDLELPEGSAVSWRLRFNRPGHYALRLGEERLDLDNNDDGFATAMKEISGTGLYRVVEITSEGEQPLPGIFTLTVTPDRAPDVRIIEPEDSTLEIPMAGPARFDSTILARDDHGIADIEIRASVAKGSGEGVKFRDEVFGFDDRTTTPDGERLVRHWDLEALGMEPGDEVYFFVVATDHRQPQANSGRSETIIVRWLDEAPGGVAAEGFAVDIMPDYFKSQRQIIIETEQLIADRDGLDQATFDATSRALGQAQSDLKQRYGQYLGDEFEEGGLHDEGDEPGGDDAHDDSHDHDHEHLHAEPGHGELQTGAPAAGVDITGGTDALVARFGHAHGAAEIGPITARNPVGMMKRSIGNMWQAELHLLLSEPEAALPYEYEALKYLNLARQAERVYTRRLGFEPPPVSEERRLEGELDDIRSYDRRLEPPAPAGDAALFGDLLFWLGTADPSAEPGVATRELLGQARDRLETLSQARPALIAHAATLERVLVTNHLDLPDCEDCVDDLREALWTLMPAPEAAPRAGERHYQTHDPMAIDQAGGTP